MSRRLSRSTLSYGFTKAFIYAAVFATAPYLTAQTLPAPSRIIYKCNIQGTVTYSDTPCVGAVKLDVEPTRGVSKMSGTERIGKDVARERTREMWAEALRPISGMDAKQYAIYERRYPLPVAAQQECRQLDRDMPPVEQEERRTAPPALHDVQVRLFLMRKRFKDLQC